MNWEDGLKKIKDILAELGYNILGYEHKEGQKAQLEPWYYPKKRGEGLPPDVSQFLNEWQNKYPLVAVLKKKSIGQQNVDYLTGIKADGLSIENIYDLMADVEDTLVEIEKKRFPKKSVKQAKGGAYWITYTFACIYKNGISEDIRPKVLGAHKKVKAVKYSRSLVIDLANQKVFKHKGFPLNTNAPGPKKLAGLLFG
ncbi:MAG: hypothetical protein KGD63_06920 [Candidatus Lokiarchaeota archaeon]|nr:hypothetical protein [Candidatus Lokiarchaeota archaeon]